MPKYAKTEQISTTVKNCYEEILKFNPNFEKKQLAVIIGSTKQNIGQRINRESKLSKKESNLLRVWLEDNGFPTKILNVAVVSDSTVQVPVRSEVELSCGTGTDSNADFVSDTIKFDIRFIRSLDGNPNAVSVVFARGDSMADRIESGDALIVDESKTYINNGKVYAFVYDSELFCKQLNKTKDVITAVSFNKEYDPFEIDKTKQFAVVGQVIGVLKRL